MDVIARTGSAPQWKWTPAYVEASEKEARKFLNEVQYDHAVKLVLSLCEEDDPTHSALVDVKPIESFYEIRDKGGVLGKINLRIYFCVIRSPKMVVVLGPWNKRKEGKAPAWILKRMKGRQKIVTRAVDTDAQGDEQAVSSLRKKGRP